ncbi:protein kinase,putative [Plasmodium sp. gorilla clade G2]|uniref:protein kinase,putative n=1 Tax=Plasmodium sp. gorilla clade G2 TaxID=880535 RepID=UPI000D20B871|nr:protein kinase,putative [Plasmodium sp. gorilla clade G2]SOV11034.1 protein kinase,putative [Plasmodium sp. gorilla clade G2]
MGFSYSSKEENAKYFHRGYILEPNIRQSDGLDFYNCIFLKKREKRLIRKVKNVMLKGWTFTDLIKIRSLNYECVNNNLNYLLRIYNIFQDQNFAYVVTENCSGGFLFDVLKNNDTIISEKILATWFYQIITALLFMEEHDIYHGNVNGYCILFKDVDRKEIRVSLLSKNNYYDNFDEDGNLYGLFYIRSPQEIRKLYYDKNNTWYIGILLHFFLFGTYPFINKNVLLSYYNIVNKDISFNTHQVQNRNFSPFMLDFLEKSLEKNYTKRPTLKDLLKHPWITGREKHPNIDIVDEKTRMIAQRAIICAENIILNLEEENE